MSAGAEHQELLPPGTPVDLENCHREPIHTPGAVQPHGVLLALDDTTGRIVQHSANASEMFGHGGLLDTPAADLLGRGLLAELSRRSRSDGGDPRPVRGDVAGAPVDVFAYRSAPGVLVLELEPAGEQASAEAVQADLARFLAALQDAGSTDALVAAAARIVHELTGFDRVWVYRFDDDDHGVVIAEERRPELPAYLGLHFPARDIPPQARAMFLTRRVRFIPDSGAAPSPLEPLVNPVSGEWLDLSPGVLRAVSPMHLQYLRNMGAHASMSIALAVRGRLWGLISGHHYAGARVVSHQARVACELIGRVCSMQLESLGALETSRRVLALDEHREAVLRGLAAEDGITAGLRTAASDLLAMCGADGAAVRIGDELELIGETPPAVTVRSLLDGLPGGEALYVTDRLEEPAAAPSCGMIAAALGRTGEDYLAWFRGEWRHELTWGDNGLAPSGNPARGELDPSASFVTWAESVTGRSRPWSAEEREVVDRLRSGLGSVLLEQAKELARINAELERSNGDLEAFGFIVAHDLREPLRGIHNFVSFFLEDFGAGLTADGREQLDTVLRLGGRMDHLMDALLDYARAGTVDPAPVEMTLEAALGETLELLPPDRRGVAIELRGGEVRLREDRERIQHVLLNLLSNALKYTTDGTGPIVVAAVPLSAVAGVPDTLDRRPGMIAVTVRDRGIGIAPEHREAIFTLFRRLHPRDAYGGGSGAGLAIARRIAERHGGALWLAESAPGDGSRFAFTVQSV